MKGDLLRGFNYKKMNIKNLNCIYLNDSEEVFRKKILKLFDFTFLFKYDKSFYTEYISNHNSYLYPDTFLPLSYLTKFSSTENIIEVNQLKDPANKNRLFELLFSTLYNITSAVKAKSELINSKKGVLERLEADSRYALNHIENNLKKFKFEGWGHG